MSFIYVGRLEEPKGVRTLFEAWKRMGDDAPELAVCGVGPLEEWCAAQAAGRHISMKGYVPSDELMRLVAQSRALILPTLLYEGFPMTIAEAFSVGTPVICSDTGNAGSLITEGVTGWKFQPGSAEGLADAVRRCLDSGDLSARVRREYEDKYTPEANYRRLWDIYTEVQNANRSVGNERRKLRH